MSKASVSARQAHLNFRRLDHLSNIQEGIGFTAIPDVLMDAYFDGRIPQAKFKLISVMLRHSAKFKVKRAYLSSRFSEKTLQKYLPEIEADGFVRREKHRLASGGYEVVYHTNRVEYWNIPSDPSQRKPSSGKPSQRKHLKETKPKKTKKKKTKEMDGCKSTSHTKPQVLPKKSQPASNGGKVVDLSKEYESYFAQGFVDFRGNNDWFSELISRKGELHARLFLDFVCGYPGIERAACTPKNRRKLYSSFLMNLDDQTSPS